MHRSGIMTLAGAGAALLLLISVPVEGAKPASKGGGGGGGGTTCSPMPVTVEIHDTDSNGNLYALRSDGGGDYIDGSAGVTAVIHNCPNGTGDMTLQLSVHKNSRSTTIDLSSPVVYSSITPSWATQTLSIGGLAIGNIWYGHDGASTDYTFTTGIAAGGFPNVNYYLRMTDPNPNEVDVVPTWTYPIDYYTCSNARVWVHWHPATTTTNPPVKQYWEVYPDASSSAPTGCANDGTTPNQVGSLIDSRSLDVAAQYSLPFYIIVREQ